MPKRKNYYAIKKACENFDRERLIRSSESKQKLSELQDLNVQTSPTGVSFEDAENVVINSSDMVEQSGNNVNDSIISVTEENRSSSSLGHSDSDNSYHKNVNDLVTQFSYASTPQSNTKESLADNLVRWYNEYNISHQALNSLLQILKPLDSSLPGDSRTLLSTKSKEIEKIGSGEYMYLGFKENILKFLHCKFGSKEMKTGEVMQCGCLVKELKVSLNINIDGLPIFKSTNTSFWPILCSCIFNNCLCEPLQPFIVSVFYGHDKPEINSYLQKCIAELSILLENGIIFENTSINVELRSIIADAPAKAFLKQTKSHSGYFACDRCVIRGEYKNRSISYEKMKEVKRTDESFRSKLYPEHHIGNSPFTNLNIDMINIFVYDYMHLILLGVVKKLLNLFMKVVPYKLSTVQKKAADNRIKIATKYFPCDFNPETEIFYRS